MENPYEKSSYPLRYESFQKDKDIWSEKGLYDNSLFKTPIISE